MVEAAAASVVTRRSPGLPEGGGTLFDHPAEARLCILQQHAQGGVRSPICVQHAEDPRHTNNAPGAVVAVGPYVSNERRQNASGHGFCRRCAQGQGQRVAGLRAVWRINRHWTIPSCHFAVESHMESLNSILVRCLVLVGIGCFAQRGSNFRHEAQAIHVVERSDLPALRHR